MVGRITIGTAKFVRDVDDPLRGKMNAQPDRAALNRIRIPLHHVELREEPMTDYFTPAIVDIARTTRRHIHKSVQIGIDVATRLPAHRSWILRCRCAGCGSKAAERRGQVYRMPQNCGHTAKP